jgi:hypothetical protein
VFASGTDAVVTVARGTITSGNGGTGSPGGTGEPGASGAVGTRGADASCNDDCVVDGAGVNCVNDGCRQTGHMLYGGAAGGPGGRGGDGGDGGGGSGGSSFSIVSVAGATVTTSGVATKFGIAGAGSGTAPSGVAGPTFAQ